MYGSSGKALKAGFWYMISNFVSKGLVFLTTPIFTRLLSKTEFGIYSNFATWQNLLMVLTTLELYSTIARAKYDYEETIDQYISTIAITGSVFTMICYAVVVVFMGFFSELFSLKPEYIHIMFLYLLTAPALQILQAKNRIFIQYKTASILTFLSSGVSVLMAIIMVYLANDKLFGRIFGQEAVLIVVNMCIYSWIIYKGRTFCKIQSRYALTIALPLIPHLLAGNLLGSFDKIIIEKISGTEKLAYYSLAFNCTLLARVLWDSFNQAMVPWLYDNLSKNNKGIIKKISRLYLAIFLFLAVGIMLLVPEVIFIFGGSSYMVAKYVMPPIIMGSCFQFAYSMYVNVEMYMKKTGTISIGTIGAAALNIPLNYIFVTKYGYIAAAYTTMVCYGVLMLFHYLMIKRDKMNEIYDNKFSFTLLMFMCVVTILMEYVYQVEMLRRLLLVAYIVIIGAAILLFRKRIIVAIKKLTKN